jgi:Kef-type K+ transport system membrane component KefB
MENSLLSIVLISIGILFIPFISKLLKIPVSVGEILYGILIGKSCINLVEKSSWLDFLSNFGFLILMFIAGLEVKIKEILKVPLKLKIISLLIPLFTFLISFLSGYIFNLNPFVSLSLGAISVGIVVSVLREKELMDSRYGKTVFLIGLIGEILSISFLTALSLYEEYKFTFNFWVRILELIIFLFFSRFILKFLHSLVWWYPNKFKFFFEKDPSEIGVRISLAIMFMLSFGASIVNIEPIIGAFISGVIFATVFEETENIEEKLSGIGFGFLVPIFFMYIGVNFKLPKIEPNSLIYLTLLIFLSFNAKLIPSFLMKFLNFNFRDSLASGFLLSAPLTLVVVTAEIGVKLKAIDEYTENVLILLAVIMGIVSPAVFNVLRTVQDGDSNS